MEKHCECGEIMTVKIRKVVYRNKVEIDHVPVYICEACSRSEVYPPVKNELVELIDELGMEPVRQMLNFAELNEVARLVKIYCEKSVSLEGFKSLMHERINELLDTLLLARSLKDHRWEDDVLRRLTQLSVSHPHSLIT
jgi:hypothetical protein